MQQPVIQPPVQIRRAGPADIQLISSLAAEIWRSYYPSIISAGQIEYMLGLMYDPIKLLAEIQQEEIEYWLLIYSGTAVGFMAFGPYSQAGFGSNAIKLYKLYLQPAFHGRGLGSLLLAKIESEARNRLSDRVFLNVNKNNSRAIRSYERNGYQTVDAVLVDIGGGYLMDDYVMEKRLK